MEQIKSIDEWIVSGESGDVTSEFVLACGYLRGEDGFPYDLVKAALWVWKAKRDEHEHAEEIYDSVENAISDDKNALSKLVSIAEKGDIAAQSFLGRLFLFGPPKTQDHLKGLHWFEKSASQGDYHAMDTVGQIYCYGLANDVLLPHYEKAVEWFKRAAEYGVASSKRMLAIAYLSGHGIEKNRSEAIRLLNEAVKAGDLRAMVELGKCYSDPSYKETQNLNDAITLLQNAKENGYDGDEPDKLIPIIKGEISSGKSGCFIATKVYGSYNCSEVIELRIFRDRYLTQTWVGRVVVDVYYALSPMLIALFGNHRNAFIIIRYMIVDPVRFIGKLLKLY